MQVLIMRHGDAMSEITNDHKKPLSDLGRYEIQLIASYLNYQNIAIEQVLVSPYLRTQQTFKYLQQSLTLPDQYQTLMELKPSGNINIICSYLQNIAHQGSKKILIISHLPLITSLITKLCHNQLSIILTTAAVVCINIDYMHDKRHICWQVNPQILSNNLN